MTEPTFEPDFQVVRDEVDEEGNRTIHEVRLRGTSANLSGDTLRAYLQVSGQSRQAWLSGWLAALQEVDTWAQGSADQAVDHGDDAGERAYQWCSTFALTRMWILSRLEGPQL